MSDQKRFEELTKLMMFWGKVPDTHLEAVKKFPWIFFNGLKEAVLEYNVATTNKNEETLFSYELALDLEQNNQLEKRYKALETAIRAQFWKEAKVKISINGEEVYKSE